MNAKDVRIFVNDACISHKSQRGVGRYTEEIVRGLGDIFGRRLCVFSNIRPHGQHVRWIWRLGSGFKGAHRLRVRRMMEGLASRLAERMGSHVFFSPYYGSATPRIPCVFTVHDLIHVTGGSGHAQSEFEAEVSNCVKRAAKLIAVSGNTADDIFAKFPAVAREKVVVVHHGIDSIWRTAKPTTEVCSKPYFIYVGHRSGHKNFETALRGFALSIAREKFSLLVVSPDRGLTHYESRLCNQLGLLDNVMVKPSLSEAQLAGAYAGAHALVYPSKYEGFGFPLLEAMASGTLVIASDAASLPEIGGNVPFYFSPNDPQMLAEQMNHIIQMTPADRSGRLSLGRIHARKFSWTECATQTARALQSIVTPDGSL